MTMEVTVPQLPTPETLERTFQCLAMLDALLSPEWQYRYHSFNTHWSNQERMGTIRDGSGDELFFLFLENGCAFKGYMQEFGNYALSDEHVRKVVPERYASVLDEPAFSPDALSFFGWHKLDKRQWNWIAPESTGAYAFPDLLTTSLFRLLISPSADLYKTWADKYYDLDIDLKSVTHIFRFLPIDKNTINILNPDLGLSDMEGDADEIGYPIVDKS